MSQLSLFPSEPPVKANYIIDSFSHNGFSDEQARVYLEKLYQPLLLETNKFSRRTVSFQANKTETLHGWMKYREGFSADLVQQLINDFNLGQGHLILDPFAGSCTALLEAKMVGVDSVGIELLPHCHLAWQAKSAVYDYNIDELISVRRQIDQCTPPRTDPTFPHLTITESAFPLANEQDLMAYQLWFESLSISETTKTLCRFMLLSILESVSLTRKDGQYLRWDSRAEKIQARNRQRVAQGKQPVLGIDKGRLPTVKEALTALFDRILFDVKTLQQDPPQPSRQTLIEGNTLYALPAMDATQFDGVITSPPYANRYDYTRTYALELAFLGVREGIFHLRQDLLSCTVENRSKETALKAYYHSIEADSRYRKVQQILESNEALAEVRNALRQRNATGEINNEGVVTMVDQYFSEMAFVFSELYRTTQPGTRVAIVNDNVRYAGEIIPVDTICTSLAEQLGFSPEQIYVLPQMKGNSSQQMSRYGRAALRKSITIWRKS
jgi:site-specific DNA-methyltransferase (cytosine-N4-specific)